MLGKGGDARRDLPAAELAALGLGAEPQLNRCRGGGGDDDAGRGHERVPGRDEGEDDDAAA